VVESQIGYLTSNLLFGHNLCFKYSNGTCKPILDIHVSKKFEWYKELFIPINSDPCNFSLKIWESNSQSENPVGNVWVHSFTPSYTPRNMKCDFSTSLLACIFASPCLGCEPKVKVTKISNSCENE
jgi:hypothetical protein